MFTSLAASETTLRQAGESAGVMMGAAFNLKYTGESDYADTFKREYSIGTAENACKWGATHSEKSSYNVDDCVNHFKLAQANG